MEKIVAGTLEYPSDAGPEPAAEEAVLTGAEAKIALAESEDDRYHGSMSGEAVAVSPGRRISGVRSEGPIPKPPFWGSRIEDPVPLDNVYEYLNEVALIRGQWQVRKGKMGDEEYRVLLEQKVYPEFAALKARARAEQLLQPRVVYGYFPCQSDGDDLVVYHEDRNTERLRFTFPRQTADRFLCLSDYFAPVGSGRMDVVAFQLVTMGKRAAEHSAKLFAKNAYKDYLYFHGLSVECAEALAELWHKRIREELGIAGRDARDMKRLFSQGYQGSRYSFGYPACPNLADQVKLFELLEGERIGVRLTEGYSLDPEQSTNAIIVHHPEARYFNITSGTRR
jgi:5-methyltetrahydrofolate--homocysteine methyltransferase